MDAQIVDLLHACLSADPATRAVGEKGLEAGALQPGFGLLLTRVSTAPELHTGTKQLAAVVLKKFVRVSAVQGRHDCLRGSQGASQEHWAEGEKHFSPPQVSDDEKAAMRDMLPRGLADGESKIRTATSMAVAAVAAFDWPEAWPALTGVLVSAIRERRSHESGA
jgi:hypothetical protein